MPSRAFYFLRHGQTDWNKNERMQGRTDVPLNDTGREQARQALSVLKNHPIDVIYASPLVRAFETAQIVNADWKLPIFPHEGLQERHYGSSEGMTFEEIFVRAQKHPELYQAKISKFPHPLDAEPIEELRGRAVKAITEALDKHEGNILFIAHGGVFSAVHHMLVKGEYTRSENGVPYRFYMDKSVWVCEKL